MAIKVIRFSTTKEAFAFSEFCYDLTCPQHKRDRVTRYLFEVDKRQAGIVFNTNDIDKEYPIRRTPPKYLSRDGFFDVAKPSTHKGRAKEILARIYKWTRYHTTFTLRDFIPIMDSIGASIGNPYPMGD